MCTRGKAGDVHVCAASRACPEGSLLSCHGPSSPVQSPPMTFPCPALPSVLRMLTLPYRVGDKGTCAKQRSGTIVHSCLARSPVATGGQQVGGGQVEARGLLGAGQKRRGLEWGWTGMRNSTFLILCVIMPEMEMVKNTSPLACLFVHSVSTLPACA